MLSYKLFWVRDFCGLVVLTLLPFNLKTATPVTGARRTISAEFGFSLAFHRLELQTKMNVTDRLNGIYLFIMKFVLKVQYKNTV